MENYITKNKNYGKNNKDKEKHDNDDWFEKAKTTRKVTALSIFVQNTIKTAKEKNNGTPKKIRTPP